MNTQPQPQRSEKPFECTECPFKSKWKESLSRHEKAVHLLRSTSSRPFPCSHPGCNFAGKQKSNLNQHSKIHSTENYFVCSFPDCDYSTNQKRTLDSHSRVHRGEKPYVCQFESCSYAASTQSHLVAHMRTHTKEKPYKCTEPNCEYAAAVDVNLKRHQLTHHPREGEERPSFSCPICEYSANRKTSLTQHIKSHTLEKLFKCNEPNCNFEAKTKTHLTRHKLVHSDEKPFACSFESCEFRCKVKGNLDVHLKSHSEERRYKCELCPYRGKTRYVVTGHLKQVHSDPNFRPFKCTEPKCGSSFKRKWDFQKHILTHGGEKHFSCSFPDCDYKAIIKSQVVMHERSVHSSERKFTCPICNFKCKTKSTLTQHLRTHTKEKPYKCTQNGCEFRGLRSSDLKTHKNRHHPQALAHSAAGKE